MNDLTPREQQICERLIHGLENKEIGVELGISHRTIEDHRLSIMRKFHVRNAVELTRVVCRVDAWQ
jgi:DNA-binding NarL/FixJ family response regulator